MGYLGDRQSHCRSVTKGLQLEILIIEDNRTLANNIRRYLELEHYAASVMFRRRRRARQRALVRSDDCIILDLDLPGMHGLEVCRRLRAAGNVSPVLMLTASGAKRDIVQGLDAGADDYLVKPFDMEELRGQGAHAPQTPWHGAAADASGWRRDAGHQHPRGPTRVRNPCTWPPRNTHFLEYLMRNAGVAQDRRTIIVHVWGEHSASIPSRPWTCTWPTCAASWAKT